MASGKLTSTGLLVSDDALVLKAQDVTQNGVPSGGKGLTVSAQTLSSGKNRSPTAMLMTLNVTTVALDGETSAGDTSGFRADKLSTRSGRTNSERQKISASTPEMHVLQVRRQHNRPWW